MAWCISNREDKLLLMNFFNALKMRVGSVEPAWFSLISQNSTIPHGYRHSEANHVK